MTTELLPCPFCGGPPDGPHLTEYIGDTYSPYYWIECSNAACGVIMELPAPEFFIIMAWNTRFEQKQDKTRKQP